jgi:acid phosphatase family membrane protein YuiD
MLEVIKEMIYVLAPLLGWFIAGSLKFLVNSIRQNSLAFCKIGYGGFPSTHSTIVSCTIMTIGFSKGFNEPLFGLGLAFLIIVSLDAIGIRKAVGIHASILNNITEKIGPDSRKLNLRESMGHSKAEVIGGIILGTLIAYLSTLAWCRLTSPLA